MRDGASRLPLIALAVLGVLIAILVGTYIHYRDSGVLVDESGSGAGGWTTEVFTANGDWDLRWSYDCSLSRGYPSQKPDGCDFGLTVKQMSDCLVSLANPGITRHGPPDHGVAHYHTGGTFYFVVDSYGRWTVTVTGPGSASGRGPAPHCTEG